MKRQILKYQQIIENINDAVYTVDLKNLMFTSANRAAERLTGYTTEELLSMKVPHVVAPESLPIVRRMIKLKKRKKETIYEAELIKKDGSRVAVEINSRAVYDESGAPIEIIGVARDITERKLHEMQRNIFVSVITHEIKNPLTSVNAYLNLLAKRTTDTTSSSHVQTALEQVKVIERMTNEFMDASQMRIGKFRIIKTVFDLNDLVDEVIKTFSVSSHNVTRVGYAKKKIRADRGRIKQVLINLISNAIKYTGKGKILVEIADNPTEVQVGVHDFGDGIRKGEQSHIFELFTRTEDATKRKIKGSGLGLYICREIIKLHKGKIWVKSSKNEGSTFYFTLPRKTK